MAEFCQISLASGARGRYAASLRNQSVSGFYPTGLTNGRPLSPASLISNRNGLMRGSRLAPALAKNAWRCADD